MARLQCADSNGYDSPVPIIGLYIAIASLVCLVLMLWDIFFAIRRKARYIPCRRFSLNSVTLTLLAIVSKLPVDLTTNMPSARDQLSKLTATTMSCICIGFMAPSLASNKRSESISNMISLSIFVVTVAVNICIQLGTGVIFSFVAEHIIIMGFMFMLLVILWLRINSDKEFISERNVERFQTIGKEGEQISLIRRVKNWYISACINNPQLFICRSPLHTAVGPICIMCSLVLLQATYRSIVVRTIEFCVGVSNYGWSMWIIVIIQIVTTIIGALTIAFRWLAIFHYFGTDFCSELVEDACDSMNLMSSERRSNMLWRILSLLIFLVFFMFLIFIVVLMFAIYFIASLIPSRAKLKLRCCMHEGRKDIVSSFPWIKPYYEEKTRDGLVQLVIEVCVDDMNKWMNLKRDSSPMVDMLRKLDDCSTTMPQELLNIYLDADKDNYGDKYNVTCLSMVVLVKVVAASVLDPSIAIIKSMRDTLGEALEIIYYVDRKMVVRYEDSRKRQLARRFWKDEDFDRSMKLLNWSEDPNDPVRCAISKMINASEILPEFALHEWIRVMNFIYRQRYATIEGLCSDVRRLFSEMLRHFLVQLPICVFKDVRDGSIEDCEERARYLTKRLCKLNPLLEDEVQWKFPDGWPPNTSRIFDGGSSAPVQNVQATTAQNVLMPQANEQQPADEILPANASNNV
ncbi:hypothetical protein Sjap_025715 [Stephania japonica]|uniref:Uncharacterized protein n=1 Tax=Stephania japonica TaxID=461633 RepID=A0AAP0HFW1_9MAGN